MTHFLRMMLITTGIAGFATIAAAGTVENGIQFNALSGNGVQFNALSGNGVQLNALSGNGVHFNALAPNALSGNAIAASGVSKAADGEAVQGLFVIGIELPNR